VLDRDLQRGVEHLRATAFGPQVLGALARLHGRVRTHAVKDISGSGPLLQAEIGLDPENSQLMPDVNSGTPYDPQRLPVRW
jgi:hypothetical protein